MVTGELITRPMDSNLYHLHNPITDDEDDELKVGDRVRYVGKKNREYYGDEIMEVVKIAVHWTGNQLTCNHSKGWSTWIPEVCLKKVEQEKDQG